MTTNSTMARPYTLQNYGHRGAQCHDGLTECQLQSYLDTEVRGGEA